MRKRRPSELECFVLGLIWQLGPCSPYDVRRHMSDSPSSQWSASTGAIYPLMRRLERRGLLKSKSERTGKRARRVYAATARGKDVLREWVGPPLAREAVSVAHDPLRSRARFLGVLSEEERTAWVAAALAALEEVGERVRRWDERYGRGDELRRLITRNGELETQARRQWLREMAERLGNGSAKGGGS